MILIHGANSIGSGGGNIKILDYIKASTASSKMEISIVKLNDDPYDFILNYSVRYLSGSYPFNPSSFFLADNNAKYYVNGAPGSGSYWLAFSDIFGKQGNIGSYTEEFFNKIKLFFDENSPSSFVAAEGGTGQTVHGYMGTPPSYFTQINFIVPSDYHEFKFYGAQIYGKSYRPAHKTDTNELGVVDEEYNFYAGVDLLGGYDN